MFNLEIDKRTLLMIVFLSVLFFFPVISSHHYYVDDLGRSIYGYSNWSQNGRPLADVLFLGLSFGPLLPDISPLPQLLSLCILSLCIYLLVSAFLKEYKNFSAIFISITLVTSPFLSENISYKYDAFPMSISILCAILPFALDIKKVQYLFCYCAVSVLLILSIYQASINIYIILAILCVLNKFRQGKTRDGLLTIGASLLGLVLSYFFYTTFISPNFIVGSYNIRHSELATSSILDALTVMAKNYHDFSDMISLAFTNSFSGFAIFVSVLAVAALFKIALTKCEATTFEKIAKYLIVIASPFVVIFMIPGPMMLLKDPVLSPRVLMAFGAACLFFSVLCAWAFSGNRKYRAFTAFIFFAYFIYSLGFSYAYSNSLNNQEKYENTIILLMISDINSLNLNDKKFIAFRGGVSLSPEGRMAAKKYPLINKLIQPAIKNQWIWGHTQMMHFDLKQKFQTFDYHMALKSRICNFELLRKSNNYNVYLDNESSTVIFEFDRADCK